LRLADRSDPLPGVGRIEARKAVGPVSVMPMPLQTRTPRSRQRSASASGKRRAAAAPVADMVERRGGEAGMVEQAW
jgi:hypothetical protein